MKLTYLCLTNYSLVIDSLVIDLFIINVQNIIVLVSLPIHHFLLLKQRSNGHIYESKC